MLPVSISNYTPQPDEFTILNMHPLWGGRIEFPDDIRPFHMSPNQRWLPDPTPRPTHPARIGDYVTPRDDRDMTVWSYHDYSSCVWDIGISQVSAIRTWKECRNYPDYHQLQLLGIPGVWWSVKEFQEYL